MVRIFCIASLALAAVSSTTASYLPVQTGIWHYKGSVSSYSPANAVDACGQVKNDFDKIAAINMALYDKKLVCGVNVEIKTWHDGKLLKRGFATIYDDCPDCNATSLKISKAVVNKIGNLNDDVPLTVDWRFK